MLLHEENFRAEAPKVRLSRHYYDLWCLITKNIGKDAMSDADLFDRVAKHRQLFFKQTWVDYTTLRRGSLRLLPSDDKKSAWQRDYDAMSESMFSEEPPRFDEVLKVVKQFEDEFNRA